MHTMSATLASVTLFIAGMAYAGGSPPVDAGFSFDIPAGAGCDFPINVKASGKTSLITLPGGRFILTSPNQRAVITNGNDPSKAVTIVVTGSVHYSTDAN